MDFTMNRAAAQQVLNEGKKIIHRTFLPDEYITMKDDRIVDEIGIDHTNFWNNRGKKLWQNGWSIYEPKKVTNG